MLPLGCRSEPSPPPAASSSARAAPAAEARPAPVAAASVAPSSEPPPVAGDAAPVGGNWLKCYANFQPRTTPELDVARLGLMCGPSNGMRKVAEVKRARAGAARGEQEHRFTAQAGECFRIFAVGEPSIEDLAVEVLDPKGNRIAFDTGDDRWPVVKPDGPFCVFDDGEYRARVRAQRGAGGYAIEIWRLR